MAILSSCRLWSAFAPRQRSFLGTLLSQETKKTELCYVSALQFEYFRSTLCIFSKARSLAVLYCGSGDPGGSDSFARLQAACSALQTTVALSAKASYMSISAEVASLVTSSLQDLQRIAANCLVSSNSTPIIELARSARALAEAAVFHPDMVGTASVSD